MNLKVCQLINDGRWGEHIRQTFTALELAFAVGGPCPQALETWRNKPTAQSHQAHRGTVPPHLLRVLQRWLFLADNVCQICKRLALTQCAGVAARRIRPAVMSSERSR